MSEDEAFLEDGEIEPEAGELESKEGPSESQLSSTFEGGDVLPVETFSGIEEQSKRCRRSRRKRRHVSKDRGNSHETVQQPDIVEIAELDEYEMLCIRGASPLHTTECYPVDEIPHSSLENHTQPTYYKHDYHYDSDDSYTRRKSPPLKRRKDRSRRRNRHRYRRPYSPEKQFTRRRSISPDEQINPEDRKMEICKFYLLDCCVKRSICKYMHSEFPCKYFHLGLECENEAPCKFTHGKALSDEMTQLLARHIAAAPKAILGNFKRYSRDKALSMIEAKNRQLNRAEGIIGNDTFSTSTASESQFNKNQNPSSAASSSSIRGSYQDISAIFSAQQIEKITALGITNLAQVKQMSLAQLTEIGLSLSQIGEIQKTTENDKHTPIKPATSTSSSSLTFGNAVNEVTGRGNDDYDFRDVNAPRDDLNAKQSPPILMSSAVNNGRKCIDTFDNRIASGNNWDDDEITDKLRPTDVDTKEMPFRAETNAASLADFSADVPFNLFDDETELVIDESDDASDCGNEETQEDLLWNTALNSINNNLEDINIAGNSDEKYEDLTDGNSSISSDTALLDAINFDEPFETTNFYMEQKISEISASEPDENAEQNANRPLTPEDQNVSSDFDMRLPFSTAIANYVPAMEIDASLKSHLGIEYKLFEIGLIDRKEIPMRLNTIPENTLDPRLKKLLKLRNPQPSGNPLPLQLEPVPLPAVKLTRGETLGDFSVDPRKRKEQIKGASQKAIVQNYNYILNCYLQKSQWYQNLNSTNKIEVNQHLADLTSKLNKFSQNSEVDRKFSLIEFQNAQEIERILKEVGLEITLDGIIRESLSKENDNEFSSMSNMAQSSTYKSMHPDQFYSTALHDFQKQQPPQPHFEFPKPGLLGIAPGVDLPPLLLAAAVVASSNSTGNPSSYRQNSSWNPAIWNVDCPRSAYSNSPYQNTMPVDQDILHRNSFSNNNIYNNNNSSHVSRRWNRKSNFKKSKRI